MKRRRRFLNTTVELKVTIFSVKFKHVRLPLAASFVKEKYRRFAT